MKAPIGIELPNSNNFVAFEVVLSQYVGGGDRSKSQNKENTNNDKDDIKRRFLYNNYWLKGSRMWEPQDLDFIFLSKKIKKLCP